MKLIIRSFFFISICLGISNISPSFGQSTSTDTTSTSTETAAPILINIPDTTTQPQLDSMATQLKAINKNLQLLSKSRSENRNAFKDLLEQTQDISSNAESIIKLLQPRLTGYDKALKLLASTTDSSSTDKAADKNTATSNNSVSNEVNKYQQSLINNRRDIQTKIQQATIIQLEGNSLYVQIQQSLASIQQIQLFTHFPSPLSSEFWNQVDAYHVSDQARLGKISSDFILLFTQNWNNDSNTRLRMLGGIVIALLIIFFVRPFVEKSMAKIVQKAVPPTRLRRSLMTLFAAILSSLTAGFSATVIFSSLGYQNTINHPAFDFSEHIIHQLFFCGFILGLYRGFLAVKNPHWRLLPINDATAKAVNVLPNLYVSIIFLLGVLKYINTTSDVSIIVQQICNGFFTILASLLCLAIPIKLRQMGVEKLASNENNAPGLTFLFIGFALPVFSIICIITVLIGYIHLGFSMCVWLNWVILVFSTLSLIRMLLIDITNVILDPDRWIGKKIRMVGVKAQSMEQLATVITGAITVLTILLIIASCISPGNFDLLLFAKHLSDILKTQQIGGINLSFATIAQAFIIFIVGIYCIRLVRNWMNKKLFPKTNLDHATRNSIDTIFNYCCWIIVAVIVLSTLGVTTQNITWIVSALSVGIGFGLQAIVQNFVSGLILLTERPVRIGDSVTVGGVKGTIKSIKVRATEIQLSDYSTLIVPNSQLITSSVQNSTRSRHLGLISIKLPVITPKELEKARELILNILHNHPDIVDNPKPSVLVDSITEISLVISITCHINTTSSSDGVKSDILLEYLIGMSKNTTIPTFEMKKTQETLASTHE